MHTRSSRTNLRRCTAISHSDLRPRHRQTPSAHLEGRGRGSLFVVQVVAEVEQDDAGQEFKMTVIRAPASSTPAPTTAEPAFETPTRWDATEPRLEDERDLGLPAPVAAVYCMPCRPRGSRRPRVHEQIMNFVRVCLFVCSRQWARRGCVFVKRPVHEHGVCLFCSPG